MGKPRTYGKTQSRRFITIRFNDVEWAKVQKHLEDNGYAQTSYFTIVLRKHFNDINVIK